MLGARRILRPFGLRRLATRTQVRPGMEVDVARLVDHLSSAGVLSAAAAKATPKLTQFSHGQSNPTYLLEVGDAPPLVLRKQPPGKLLRGAHAVDREFKVTSALHAHGAVPVATPRLYVEGSDVIGTPFFVCDYVEGRLFLDATMEGATSAAQRASLYRATVDAACQLHRVDFNAAGLGSYGKVGGYLPRQTKVWTSQYRAAETHAIEPIEYLASWLPDALPKDDDLTCLVHGDLRVDNLIFHHGEDKV